MNAPTPSSIAVLGAGAWGTAFALHLARQSPATITLWSRDPRQAQMLARDRVNARYLPGVTLPPALRVTGDLAAALRGATLLIAATPMAALPELIERCRNELGMREDGSAPPFFWLSKGLLRQGGNGEDGDVVLPHRALASRWPAPVGAISGPSFAQEVAQGLPTALVIAGTETATVVAVAAQLHGGALRIYPNDDLIGVETGGAVKNVLAIAAGISDGLKLGHNARATLMTRGLAEMARLAEALGGRRTTLMGLAGLGDLVLTCTGDLSRNRRLGLMLAEGLALPDILTRLGHVAEGVPAAHAVVQMARQQRIELPIAAAVARILKGELAARDAVETLLRRAPAAE